MQSGIRDNHKRGSIGEYLKEQIKSGSDLSIVSAYFTIYAYEKLKDKLDSINHLRFLFGEPTFIKPNQLNPELKNPREYKIQENGSISLENALQQKSIAKECASWLEAPIKLTTSGRGKLTTCFAGEDLVVQVCQC